MTDDAAPPAWKQKVLEHERRVLREEAALGQERLRLIAELRRIREERVTLLGEQAALLATRHGSLLRPLGRPTALASARALTDAGAGSARGEAPEPGQRRMRAVGTRAGRAPHTTS